MTRSVTDYRSVSLTEIDADDTFANINTNVHWQYDLSINPFTGRPIGRPIEKLNDYGELPAVLVNLS